MTIESAWRSGACGRGTGCWRAARAGRLDRELAEGASPEASAALAARAMRLTSTGFRSGLAASLRRIVVATGEPVPVRSAQVAAPKSPATARPPRIPLRRARISQSARLLAELASRLAAPGPVPVCGVAMVTRLLSDGTGRYTARPAMMT
jgi:hypothetical protein